MGNFLARMPRGLSRILFGTWVIAIGVVEKMNLHSPGMNVLLGIVLIAAGIFTLLEP